MLLLRLWFFVKASGEFRKLLLSSMSTFDLHRSAAHVWQYCPSVTDDGVSVSLRLSLRLDAVRIHSRHGLQRRLSAHRAHWSASSCVYDNFSRHTSLSFTCSRAVQPVATCRQSPYLHKPAIVIVASFSLWRLALAALAAPVLIITSFSLWRHSLLSWPRPPLRTYVRTPYRV